MRTSTKEAFLLLEDWKAEGKILHVVAAPGGRFSAVVSSVSRSKERVILRNVLGERDEVPFNLSGAVFEYAEPGVAVGPGIEKWHSFLKADLLEGGMIMFLVPRSPGRI